MVVLISLFSLGEFGAICNLLGSSMVTFAKRRERELHLFRYGTVLIWVVAPTVPGFPMPGLVLEPAASDRINTGSDPVMQFIDKENHVTIASSVSWMCVHPFFRVYGSDVPATTFADPNSEHASRDFPAGTLPLATHIWAVRQGCFPTSHQYRIVLRLAAEIWIMRKKCLTNTGSKYAPFLSNHGYNLQDLHWCLGHAHHSYGLAVRVFGRDRDSE